ncbi:hypothetical protein AS850_06295 [Frondihabitans sp. 762G35]|uniref:hypothetical protein n=1 Tax=Frondihabitans sp. 762G35 TaxID=1446794 RepID=UPI000D200B19|nr:hypothetical protein [Frondihabitans sp. 762G35]ARC56683.1 hypothetical protein AS850_06295 [Frondihabitans sp. 762G35]
MPAPTRPTPARGRATPGRARATPTRRRKRQRRRDPGPGARLLGVVVALGVAAVVALGASVALSAAGSPITTIVGGLGDSSAPGTAQRAGTVSCPRVAPVVVGSVTVPAGPIAGYCQDRLINAAHIINAAKAQGIGPHTQAIGVMTAMGESSLVNVDHGDAVGPDSRGLFQQRDNGAWGSYTDRMTPYIAATHFFDRLVRVPGWKSLTPTQAAHRVQVNADPNHYAPYWPAAVAVVSALDPAG